MPFNSSPAMKFAHVYVCCDFGFLTSLHGSLDDLGTCIVAPTCLNRRPNSNPHPPPTIVFKSWHSCQFSKEKNAKRSVLTENGRVGWSQIGGYCVEKMMSHQAALKWHTSRAFSDERRLASACLARFAEPQLRHGGLCYRATFFPLCLKWPSVDPR